MNRQNSKEINEICGFHRAHFEGSYPYYINEIIELVVHILQELDEVLNECGVIFPKVLL